MRYPTRNGIPVSPYELGYSLPEGKHTNHHASFPRLAYRQGIYVVMRGLVSGVYPMIPEEHNIGKNNLHNKFDPPKMPTEIQVMDYVEEYLAIHGVLDIVREHKTCETYQLQPHQWEGIKRGQLRQAS